MVGRCVTAIERPILALDNKVIQGATDIVDSVGTSVYRSGMKATDSLACRLGLNTCDDIVSRSTQSMLQSSMAGDLAGRDLISAEPRALYPHVPISERAHNIPLHGLFGDKILLVMQNMRCILTKTNIELAGL